MRSALYTGTLMHARRSPRRNVFRYPVSYWLLDLDELPELERRLAPIAVNRRGLVTFRDSDHFDGSPVKQAVIDFTGDPSIERVLMLTQLRVLGYVFNPVSFYWCYRRAPQGGDRAGTEDHAGEERAGGEWELACMVAELGNTFGERLPELLRGPVASLRPRQAPARLAVLRSRPVVRVRLLAAGRRGLGAHPRPRRRRRDTR